MILTFWNKFSLTLYKYKAKKKKKKYNNYLVALTKHFQEGMGNTVFYTVVINFFLVQKLFKTV